MKTDPNFRNTKHFQRTTIQELEQLGIINHKKSEFPDAQKAAMYKEAMENGLIKPRLTFSGYKDQKGQRVYTAKWGTSTYHNFSIEGLKQSLAAHQERNNDGAIHGYGAGTYNGD